MAVVEKREPGEGTAAPVAGETEVVAKARRRRFTAEYKRRIVREADRCTHPGEIGALLRREGLYSSHLTTWRACTGPCRTPIPAQAEHPFRRKPNTDSDGSRTPIPGCSNTLSGCR